MKRILAVLLIALVLLNCVGCQQTVPEQHSCRYPCVYCGRCRNLSCGEATCVQKCQGHHFCQNRCPTCKLCLQSSCEDKRCKEKCQGHKEEPYQFPTSDYFITTEPITIDTGTFVYHIPENVYVRGDLEEITNIIVPIMEQVSGLTFEGNGYCQDRFPDEKIHLYVDKVGGTYASPVEHVQKLLPSDLFFAGEGYVIVHETAHMLMFRQSEWIHSTLLDESISTYTTYLVEKELEKISSAYMFRVGWSQGTAASYCYENIKDYEKNYGKLFECPLEYWFDHTFEYSYYENYTIGFLFAAYLHETYGNYTKWVTEFENMYSFRDNFDGFDHSSTVEQQIAVLKATYGEDVLDGFYPWLKEKPERFGSDNLNKYYRDTTDMGCLNFYPVYNGTQLATISNLQFEDLYINLETMRTYLEEYCQKETSGLMFTYVHSNYNQPLTMNLYRSDGSYTTVVTDKSANQIPLDGISYIKLVGAGKINFAFFEGVDLEGMPQW